MTVDELKPNKINDPSTLDWQPSVKVEHYRLQIDSPTNPVVLREYPPNYGEAKKTP